MCGCPVDPLRARVIAVVAGRVVGYCSATCRERAATGEHRVIVEPSHAETRARRRLLRRFVGTTSVLVVIGVLLGVRVTINETPATAALFSHPIEVPDVAISAVGAGGADDAPEEEVYGPQLPPPDFFVEGDRWVHPLAGPVRRLPERPTRRFGVDRAHDSHESCRGGHCGVDVGELRGESVLAAHDGVVERVVRAESGDKGGRYVRLLHAGGKIVTQYMHLDAVEPLLKPGMHVRAGETLGTVGDSGTLRAGPHLHFTVSTRSAEGRPERYIDPEPLLTLWPLIAR